ncbi:hypothetical protein KIPB_006453 [Kipferlia bialata]|uniref:Uncharacterized protein n=1 Tax=Kipferlia bialata TaxID=797122 RepID=A0A9K3CYM4_9EUKA|nr:hypothetical protein KIPB_006453 [Kipferlia bialata]|eukprot:g6453.t1
MPRGGFFPSSVHQWRHQRNTERLVFSTVAKLKFSGQKFALARDSMVFAFIFNAVLFLLHGFIAGLFPLDRMVAWILMISDATVGATIFFTSCLELTAGSIEARRAEKGVGHMFSEKTINLTLIAIIPYSIEVLALGYSSVILISFIGDQIDIWDFYIALPVLIAIETLAGGLGFGTACIGLFGRRWFDSMQL